MAKQKNDAMITFAASPDVKKALEELAHDERRSMSGLVRIAVEEYLIEKGYLTPPTKKRESGQDDNQS